MDRLSWGCSRPPWTISIHRSERPVLQIAPKIADLSLVVDLEAGKDHLTSWMSLGIVMPATTLARSAVEVGACVVRIADWSAYLARFS